MAWDGADQSASLAKDIAAFANSRDGGVIVLGKGEAADKSFQYTGLTPEQASTFDTTKVAQWVNARFSPPIRLVCYQQQFQKRVFVVIAIQQFLDIPAICIKSFQQTDKPRHDILREGAIYIRNQNAESKPLRTTDELRSLIGLATQRRGDELIAHFRAMLKGSSLLALGPAPDPFAEQVRQVQSDLGYAQGEGGWWLSFHPHEYMADRWSSTEELERFIAAHSVRLYEEFPGHKQGTFRMGWGIANDLYNETWALTKSGLFCFWRQFREDSETPERTGYRGGEKARQAIPPGEWIEFTWSIRTVLDFFMFMSRLVAEYGAGANLHVQFKVGPLAGRKLISQTFGRDIGYGAPEPSRAPEFVFDKTVTAEALQADWEQLAAEVLRQFFELFPIQRISHDALLRLIARFKERQL